MKDSFSIYLRGETMVRRQGGIRRKTRSKLSKPFREKSKLSLKKYFQSFNVGDKAVLNAEPSIQKGMFMPRFQGKIGRIKSKIGSCYHVTINDKNKEKVLVVHPVHLKKVQ